MNVTSWSCYKLKVNPSSAKITINYNMTFKNIKTFLLRSIATKR